MAEAMAHRGPDDQDEWVDETEGLAVAYRRLAIIDTSELGHQPMASSCGRYVLVYNGEIYNHREMRRALEGRGRRFRGHSDTEVLIEAISEWGLEATLRKTNGMFGLAVWDRKRRLLCLARDRLGEKPLYYGWNGRTFLFASEVRALSARNDFEGQINRDSLSLLIRFNFIPARYSIFDGIQKLAPGSFVEVSPDKPGELPTPRLYWSLHDVVRDGASNGHKVDEREALELFEELFLDSVERRLISDVPLGAFLSGGIDSSLVVAAMSRLSSVPVRTFTIGFPNAAFNEAREAAAVAQHLGTDHTELYVSPQEAIDTIPRLPALYDEPFADSSQIPTQLVAELARKDVTVALSGDGGDESFAGYPRHKFAQRLAPFLSHLPRRGRMLVARAARARSAAEWDRTFAQIDRMVPARLRVSRPGDKLGRAADLFGIDNPDLLYRDLLATSPNPTSFVLGASEPATILTEPQSWPPGLSPMQMMMYLDTAIYLPDDILTKVDRATMATSLEARVPFLDHRLVEFAWGLPTNLKYRRGQSKYLPKQMLAKYVPSRLFERPKMGFGVPLDEWLRGPLREWAEDLLDENRMQTDGYLNHENVRKMWVEHLSGVRDRKYNLWGILMFQAWLANLKRAPATAG
jgi:asparagine synthase (glutamine-hydrolysing)